MDSSERIERDDSAEEFEAVDSRLGGHMSSFGGDAGIDETIASAVQPSNSLSADQAISGWTKGDGRKGHGKIPSFIERLRRFVDFSYQYSLQMHCERVFKPDSGFQQRRRLGPLQLVVSGSDSRIA